MDALLQAYRSVPPIVFRDLMRQFQFIRPSFRPTPEETAFREGERSVVIYMLGQAQAAGVEGLGILDDLRAMNHELAGPDDDTELEPGQDIQPETETWLPPL